MNTLNNIEKFIIFCLELYRTEKKYAQKKALNDFKKYHVFDFIKNGFEVLHTQSPHYIYQEIEDFINHKK
ncbi:DUF3791 domain-containing protein [Kaistella sp.]|uniref:DUF3791 domain-containing protein n=1 Tax=Kaistella sp. TaxID=2782235 RepID=UPI003C60D3AB